MKRYTLGIVASLSASLFMTGPAMAQYSNYAECTEYYSAHFYQQLADCASRGWGDAWLRELCEYAAGQERDQNMNYCSNAYPENVSHLTVPASRWTRSEFALAFRESNYSELLARTAAAKKEDEWGVRRS
ncbi:hypothetical protein [Sphingomonas psychrotolerans]|uniref:hypothetical protein n=1 Tax=Sphingomonas psychrotolerans TaxID=1327635 RepID=UPI0013052A0B|nr:hypothetical protein [Sphingomonas psychrotolerans]